MRQNRLRSPSRASARLLTLRCSQRQQEALAPELPLKYRPKSCIHDASRVVLVHNHPSGECDPSKEDIDTTNRITQALKYVGIRVLDHIIVGRARQDYFSFARAGMV